MREAGWALWDRRFRLSSRLKAGYRPVFDLPDRRNRLSHKAPEFRNLEALVFNK